MLARKTTGGAVQGSVLGVLDHNAVMETVDNDFNEPGKKYVDDLTTLEKIPHGAAAIVSECEDSGSRSGLLKSFHAEEMEKNIANLQATCERRGLKINGKKTQLLAISTNKIKTEAWINVEDEQVTSSASLKLLGFVFGNTPGVSLQVENLVRKAMFKYFILRQFANFMPGQDLLKLYNAQVLSVLEYSSVTYGPMLTKYQSNMIENVQKRCLRCMYGWNCLLYTSPSPRDLSTSRMPSSA